MCVVTSDPNLVFQKLQAEADEAYAWPEPRDGYLPMNNSRGPLDELQVRLLAAGRAYRNRPEDLL